MANMQKISHNRPDCRILGQKPEDRLRQKKRKVSRKETVHSGWKTLLTLGAATKEIQSMSVSNSAQWARDVQNLLRLPFIGVSNFVQSEKGITRARWHSRRA